MLAWSCGVVAGFANGDLEKLNEASTGFYRLQKVWLFLFPPNRYRRQKYGRNKQTKEGDFALFIPTG